jgi:hypothetical protein
MDHDSDFGQKYTSLNESACTVLYLAQLCFPINNIWVRSVSWSEYSAPKLKLCFKRPVLNLPVKANWSVKVSVSATREFARAQTFPVKAL